MPLTLHFPPRLLPSPQAAHYLGISEGMLRSLNIPRRILGSKRLYDRLALDEFASSLPTEGDIDADVAACDRAFGLTT